MVVYDSNQKGSGIVHKLYSDPVVFYGVVLLSERFRFRAQAGGGYSTVTRSFADTLNPINTKP